MKKILIIVIAAIVVAGAATGITIAAVNGGNSQTSSASESQSVSTVESTGGSEQASAGGQTSEESGDEQTSEESGDEQTSEESGDEQTSEESGDEQTSTSEETSDEPATGSDEEVSESTSESTSAKPSTITTDEAVEILKTAMQKTRNSSDITVNFIETDGNGKPDGGTILYSFCGDGRMVIDDKDNYFKNDYYTITIVDGGYLYREINHENNKCRSESLTEKTTFLNCDAITVICAREYLSSEVFGIIQATPELTVKNGVYTLKYTLSSSNVEAITYVFDKNVVYSILCLEGRQGYIYEFKQSFAEGVFNRADAYLSSLEPDDEESGGQSEEIGVLENLDEVLPDLKKLIAKAQENGDLTMHLEMTSTGEDSELNGIPITYSYCNDGRIVLSLKVDSEYNGTKCIVWTKTDSNYSATSLSVSNGIETVTKETVNENDLSYDDFNLIAFVLLNNFINEYEANPKGIEGVTQKFVYRQYNDRNELTIHTEDKRDGSNINTTYIYTFNEEKLLSFWANTHGTMPVEDENGETTETGYAEITAQMNFSFDEVFYKETSKMLEEIAKRQN